MITYATITATYGKNFSDKDLHLPIAEKDLSPDLFSESPFCSDYDLQIIQSAQNFEVFCELIAPAEIQGISMKSN